MAKKEIKSKWALGSIVSLKSHFYEGNNDTNLVYLSGEPQLISPLMVITETFGKESATLETESNFQYKCMWYSNKTQTFEENWFPEKHLKTIAISIVESKSTKDSIKLNSIVEFKTCSIELGKKKITLKQSSENLNNKSYAVNSHLSFVSPVLQVMDIIQGEDLLTILKSKHSDKRRNITKTLIKCKYYNFNSDKFSEVLIPVEALDIIPKTEKLILTLIKKCILNNKHLVIKDKNSLFDSNLIKPEHINYRAGRYYLSGFDYMKSKNVEINIAEISILNSKEKYFKDELPKFTGSIKLKVSLINNETLQPLIAKYNTKKDKAIWIQYEDLNDVRTKRIITNCSILESDIKERDTNNKLVNVNYLKAFCLLRKATRYFRIDRIREIKILDLS